MSSGEVFLKRVRDALATDTRPGGASARIEPRGRIGYQGAGCDPVACFLERFSSAGGKAHRVTGGDGARAIALDLIRQFAPKRVVLGEAKVIEDLNLTSELTGLSV